MGACASCALDILDVPRSCCHSLEDLVFRRSHAGTDEPLLVGAVAATAVAITHLFVIVSMPVMGSTILSMEVAVLTVMVAMLAMELIVVAVVVMVVAMISGFGGISAMMMAMDVAAIFIVMMTGFMAVVVAGSLCRCGSFGTDILVLFVRLVRIHKMDSFLRRQVDRLQ